MPTLFESFHQSGSGSRIHLPSTSRIEEDLKSLRRAQEELPSKSNGSPFLPTKADFSSSLSLIISQHEVDEPVEHIVIYLHQLGENEASLQTLAQSLKRRLPRSAYILIRGVEPVPSGGSGYQWADSQSQWDERYLNASRSLLTKVIKDVLISKCNFIPSNIMILGHCEGGMAALAMVALWEGIEFGGVISIEGPLPSHVQLPSTVKAKTPALILRAVFGDIVPSALQRIKDTFMTVDVETREEAIAAIPDTNTLGPILAFFAHRFHREEWEKQAIISIDGGGVRSLGSLLILQELMNKVGDEEKRMGREDEFAESSFSPCEYKPRDRRRRLTDIRISSATNTVGLPNSSLYLPCHYFDYAAGTSTGGLICILLSRFRMTVDDCIDEYKSFAGRIFGHPRPIAKGPMPWYKFSTRVLEQVIRDVTSRHSEAVDFEATFPSDEDLCRTVVYAYADHLKNDIPYAFRTYCLPERVASKPGTAASRRRTMKNYGSPPMLPIWQVARATSAAPGYFRPIKINKGNGSNPRDRIRFKDGGFGTNNPTKEAYYDIVEKHGSQSKIGLVISIGTGDTPLSSFARKHGHLNNAIANLKAATRLPSRTLKAHEDMLRLAEKDGVEEAFLYFRFGGGEPLGTVALDEWESHHFTKLTGHSDERGSKTIKKIEVGTVAYLQRSEVQRDLAACAKMLVRRRRLRTRDMSQWDRYASASYYECDFIGCEARRTRTIQEYEEHVRSQHDIQVADSVFEKTMQLSRRCWVYGNRAVRNPKALDRDEGLSMKPLETDDNTSTEEEFDLDESASTQDLNPDKDLLMKENEFDDKTTKRGADLPPEDEFNSIGVNSSEDLALDQFEKNIAIDESSSDEKRPANESNPETTMPMQDFELIDPLSMILQPNLVRSTAAFHGILNERVDRFYKFLLEGSITFIVRLLSTSSNIFDYWKKCWEPSLPSDKIRIRWTCQCGKMLWDDFEELRPGAADHLQRDLDSYKRASMGELHGIITQASGSNYPHIPAPVYVSTSRSGSTVPAFVSSTYSGSNPITSRGSIVGVATNAASPGTPPTLEKENFLLLCSSKPNDTLRLSQLYVGEINDDVTLFRRLNEVYEENRGKLTRVFSLRKIKSINFRKFERHPRERVVIYSCPNIIDTLPQRTNPCACHPGHAPPKCNTVYDLEPTPPDLDPYVGRNGLEHLLEHPHEAAEQGNNLPVQNVWLKRFPKKKTKLRPCPKHQYGLGWGIEFEEGWNMTRVIAVVAVFILVAIIFLICWWKVFGDLQGATGMGSLLLGFPTLLLTAFSLLWC